MGARGAQPGYLEWEKPSKLNYLKNLAMQGLTSEEISLKLGIGLTTYYDWIKKSPKIKNSISIGKDEADAVVEQALYKRACEGDFQASRFWLMNRQPDRYKEKQDINMRTEQVVIYDGVPDEDDE